VNESYRANLINFNRKNKNEKDAILVISILLFSLNKSESKEFIK